MADLDKNIIITPNVGQSAEPNIRFLAANSSVNAQTITMTATTANDGTLMFSGSSGNLFSISSAAPPGGNVLTIGGATTITGNLFINNTGNGITFSDGTKQTTAASGGLAVTDDTTTNASRYVLFTDQTSGTMSSEFVSSTKMYFNPSTGKLNATSFNSLSDVFSKENIKTLDNAISKILMMRGVSFTWKGTEDKSIGLIAQEVEQIIPEVVSTSEDGIKSVSYDSIIGLLIEGIKEQQQTIEQMKNSINILLDRINIEGDGK